MRLLTITILLAIPYLASAQYSETMSSDRPGQSITPNTVGKNVLQIQGGYIHDNYESTGELRRGVTDEYSENSNYGNLKLRYGVFDKTEVSGQLSYGGNNSSRNSVDDSWKTKDKMDIVEFGFGIRQNILDEGQHGVSLGLEGAYFYDRYDVEEFLFTLSAGRQFFEKLSVTANAGYFIEGDLFFTANVGYQVIENLGVYIEYYPIIGERLLTDEDFQFLNSTVNAGLFYQLTPNLMVDATAGFLATDIEREDNVDISSYSIQIGFTSRLDWHK